MSKRIVCFYCGNEWSRPGYNFCTRKCEELWVKEVKKEYTVG